jgi:O-methyltransferase
LLELHNVHIVSGVFPDQTAELMASVRFCFCHIDVDTYASARDAFEFVWPRLQDGGIIVFDDYGFQHVEGVTRIVNELLAPKDRRFVYNLSGQGIFLKLDSRSSRNGAQCPGEPASNATMLAEG